MCICVCIYTSPCIFLRRVCMHLQVLLSTMHVQVCTLDRCCEHQRTHLLHARYRMCICAIYIHVYMHICMCRCVYMHVYIFICMYAFTCIWMYIYVYVYVHVYVCIYIEQRKQRHSLKLGKKRQESSKRNYYIISPRVIIKAIINQCKLNDIILHV